MTTMTKFATALHALVLLAAASALTACGRTPIGDYSQGVGGSSGTGGSKPGGCTTNADCPSGEECNPTTHMCVPIPGGCTSAAQCAVPTPHCRLATGTRRSQRFGFALSLTLRGIGQ